MALECPKCGRKIPDDSIYCPYCGQGIKPSARSTQVSVAGAFMIVAATGSLIFLILSLQALLNIYSWYPPLVAQSWFIYDQMLTISTFTELLFGLIAAVFSLSRKSYRWTMISSILCTLSGCVSWTISTIIPHSNVVQSFLYYFMPLLMPPLVATILIFLRKPEFNSIPKK